MKKVVLFLLVIAIFSCNKEQLDKHSIQTLETNQELLIENTVDLLIELLEDSENNLIALDFIKNQDLTALSPKLQDKIELNLELTNDYLNSTQGKIGFTESDFLIVLNDKFSETSLNRGRDCTEEYKRCMASVGGAFAVAVATCIQSHFTVSPILQPERAADYATCVGGALIVAYYGMQECQSQWRNCQEL